MSLLAFILIVVSAGLHATWNLLAKKDHLTLPYYAILCTPGALVWLHMQFWSTAPVFSLPKACLLCLACSVTADILYCIGLGLAYRHMEMASAYPMMRSLPILLTALVTTLFGIGRTLSVTAVAGFCIVFCGAMLMPLVKFSDFSLKKYFNRAIFGILLAACGTTCYTICDSQGLHALAAARPDMGKTLLTLSYYSSRALLLASSLWIITALRRENRAVIADYWKRRLYTPIIGGVCGSLTYILVMIAMHYVDNVAYVQVFRQLGLPIGMAAGVLFLHERCSAAKITGVSLILLGLAISVL